MAYFSKAQLLNGEGDFQGSFLELDGELAYLVPDEKSGTVSVNIRYGDASTGAVILDADGNPLPSFVDSISVADGSSP